MNKTFLKKLLPHVIAIVTFLLVAIVYCRPALDGKVLQQQDIMHWKGMAQNAFEYKEQHGHFPLWNTHLFSGMPNYQVAMDGKSFIPDFNKILSLGLPQPISFFFLACICFYILASVYGINYIISILSALAFAYASYDPIIISVGHVTKMMAIAYMPGLLAGLLLLFKRKYIAGIVVTALFATLEIGANHPQISYYLAVVVAIMTVTYIIKWIKEAQWKHMIAALSLALLGGLIGLANNSGSLLTTYEYAKYTMRGGKTVDISEENNTIKKTNTTGLDQDYAFTYSIAKGEALTLLMPKAYGSSSSETYDENSKIVSDLTEKNIPEGSAAQLAASIPKYWGGIVEGTSGPVYLGAIICILFVIGLIIVKGEARWWILIATAIGIFMAWGKYFLGFNEFLFNHLPMYNKFRAPSMALVIPQLLLPLLAALALQDLLFTFTRDELKAKFKKILYAVGGLLALAALVYVFTDFSSDIDGKIIQAYSNPQTGDPSIGHTIVRSLIQERKDMFGSGLLRAFLFAVVVIGLLWMYLKNILRPVVIICILAVVNTADLLMLDSKYLSSDSYIEPESNEAGNFTPSPADTKILMDKSPHYRVFNLSPERFNDAITSYFHRSIGGYHPAKLRIYQDLIEAQLSKDSLNMPVLNMLDARYFIEPAQRNSPAPPTVRFNENALGACWFVKEVKFVDGPVEELRALDNFNPSRTAFVDNSFKNLVSTPTYDSTATIKLVDYSNDDIKYETNAATSQFAVLSEIYYPAGWNAYMDGKKVDYCKTNYVLRGLPVPAGKHEFEFKFEPSSYYTGQKLAYVGNALLWLALLSGLLLFIRKQKQATTA